jgi:hypothetical protein
LTDPTDDHSFNRLVRRLWVVPALGILLPPLVFLLTFDQPLASDDVLLSLFVTTTIGFVVLLILLVLKRKDAIDLKQRSIRLALWLAFADGIGGILFSMLLAASSVH